MKNRENLLTYIGIAFMLIIVGIFFYIISTQVVNTPEENGNAVSNNVSEMSKDELESYISLFVTGMEKEYDKLSDLSDKDLFWFAVRVYMTKYKVVQNKYGLYELPKDQLEKILYEYLGVKTLNYIDVNGDHDLQYDKEKKSYTSKLDWDYLLYGQKDDYSVAIYENLNNKDSHILKVSLVYKNNESETKKFTLIMNDNNYVSIFKKTTDKDNNVDLSKLARISYKEFNSNNIKKISGYSVGKDSIGKLNFKNYVLLYIEALITQMSLATTGTQYSDLAKNNSFAVPTKDNPFISVSVEDMNLYVMNDTKLLKTGTFLVEYTGSNNVYNYYICDDVKDNNYMVIK